MSDRLGPGQQLNVNDRLVSPNGKVTLVMQGDGNLVLYRNDSGLAVWSTNTWGTPVTHAVLQNDGNFVCYDTAGKPYWASNTDAGSLFPLQRSVILQDDGNLVICDNPTGAVLWTSNTFQSWGRNRLVANQQLKINDSVSSLSGKVTLVMQADGNLVIYRVGNGALWSTNTWGKPVTHTIMQADGNLVCYDDAGAPYWSSNTWDTKAAYAELLDDGTLVLCDPTGQVLWSSNPALVNASLQCQADRGAGTGVEVLSNYAFQNWPMNIQFNAPAYFRPKTRVELVNAVLGAEGERHHVRAVGSGWSFSDAICATDDNRVIPGVMIDTTQLAGNLQSTLQPGIGSILAAGVDPTFLVHVEAGITISDLNFLLDHQPGRQTLDSGGGSGQTLGGVISTSTHGGDSLVPPLADYVCAIHLIGAGGVEYWIEPDSGITNAAQLQVSYPCLSSANINYSNDLFNSVLCSAGSMGVIYSVILKTVPQFGLVQHRVATTWESLLASAGANLTGVLDGSFLSTKPGTVNILDGTPVAAPLGPYAGNRFSQVVINPYPLEGNDASLSNPEKAHVGEHLCLVTNRVPIPIPSASANPGGGDIGALDVHQIGQAARNSLGSNVLDYDIRFKNFLDSIQNVPDLSTKAALLVNFLADNFDQRTISAVVTSVLTQIMPVGERVDVSYKLADVLTWGASIKSLSLEAAFSIPDALAFVPQVLALVASYAAKSPQIYVGGYLSLRFVGKKTKAFLGMQQWSPTCCVEYAMLAGSRGISDFVKDLQQLALRSHGALHWGQCNDVVTSNDLQNIYGAANVQTFKQSRAILSANGLLATFNNSFTDRLGISV
jgi:hypothetical protein